jgi:hypothetical protein
METSMYDLWIDVDNGSGHLHWDGVLNGRDFGARYILFRSMCYSCRIIR